MPLRALQLDLWTEQRAQRKRRAAALYECDCHDQVGPSADDVIQGKRKGCETVWVSNLLSVQFF